MRARRRPSTHLGFNVEEWNKIAQRLGLETDAAKAQFLGVDPSNYHRISRGQNSPSSSFVARTMKALRGRRGVTFERLFPIVERDPVEAKR